jgi:hypothetical protein
MSAVKGDSNNNATPAVLGQNTGGGTGVRGQGHVGVSGDSPDYVGVLGTSQALHDAAVMGVNDKGWGVTGRSAANTGVSGESNSGIGVHGKGGLLAGFFECNVKFVGELYVQGNVRIPAGGDLLLEGADCAEQFDVDDLADIEPGSVLIIRDDGALEECSSAYDTRVVGVVSGAGNYRPGIVLDNRVSARRRQPIALVGKTYVKADAGFGPISPGDLLTTSATPGHAMRAAERSRASGSLLGKALAPLYEGCGLIPILVTLQ